MPYQIIWTAEADNDFHSIITYLKENWSDHTAEKFAIKTINKLERIASKPYSPRYVTTYKVCSAASRAADLIGFMSTKLPVYNFTSRYRSSLPALSL
jgi:plasmid stabilization system protein ParE